MERIQGALDVPAPALVWRLLLRARLCGSTAPCAALRPACLNVVTMQASVVRVGCPDMVTFCLPPVHHVPACHGLASSSLLVAYLSFGHWQQAVVEPETVM